MVHHFLAALHPHQPDLQARLLCLAVVHTFRSEHPREVALARSSLLEGPTRGTALAADSLLLASNGLLGAALRLDSGSHASYEAAAAAAAGETEGGEVELAALDVDGGEDGEAMGDVLGGDGGEVLGVGEGEEQGPSLWRALLTGEADSTPPDAAMLGGLGWEAV